MTRKHKSPSQQTLKFKLARALRPWHRRLGIISCIFILLLVITGVAINHSQALHLGKTPVQQSWLLDFYGIAAPTHAAQFTQSSEPLFITDNLLWLGSKPILEAPSQLLSAISFNDLVIAIDKHQLYLFDSQGRLQETQNSSTGLPDNLAAIAVEASTTHSNKVNLVWLKTDSGYFQADENLIDWIPAQPLAPLPWVTPLKTIDAHLVQHARSANLNWERVILDLHSGRLFGAYAVWIWDMFALALLLVSLSGLWIWVKQARPKR